ncbi:MAG: hypothetical protein AB1Z23_12380 [Eubacteriales bacterium]
MGKRFFQHKREAAEAFILYIVWMIMWVGMLLLHIKMKNDNNISAIAPLFLSMMFLFAGFAFLTYHIPKYAFDRIAFGIYGVDVCRYFKKTQYAWDSIKGKGSDCWVSTKRGQDIHISKTVLYVQEQYSEETISIKFDKRPEIENLLQSYYKTDTFFFDQTNDNILQ